MKQIAVVEDEPLMREELALMLRKAGYEAIEIREFDHVAEQLEQISPDLAVLDLNLPGVSGFQICREIKGRREAYRDYRVSTVFLGGGTPSVLTGEETARIFHALGESFDISRDAEITMEVNPGTVTGEKAAAWRQCGVGPSPWSNGCRL